MYPAITSIMLRDVMRCPDPFGVVAFGISFVIGLLRSFIIQIDCLSRAVVYLYK